MEGELDVPRLQEIVELLSRRPFEFRFSSEVVSSWLFVRKFPDGRCNALARGLNSSRRSHSGGKQCHAEAVCAALQGACAWVGRAGEEEEAREGGGTSKKVE